MEFKFRKKQYVLNRDANCFTLASMQKNAKTEELEPSHQRYFTDLKQAVKYLFNEHILDKNKYTSIIEKIDAINKDLDVLLRKELNDEQS